MGVSSAITGEKPLRKGPTPAASRPPREDHYLLTSLDKRFSDWKVLVGPDDWRNYHNGLEGAAKYRLHNLPSAKCFHSGVYELALYLDKSIHAHSTRKGFSSHLRKDTLVPVYVGQAENVRDRLQDYGRCGSHLEGSLQNGKCQQCEIFLSRLSQNNIGFLERILICPKDVEEEFCSSLHLFTKAFDQGYFIAFRWIATKSKVEAAALEAYLLQSYDYAWNRGSNGERRPADAYRKMQDITKAESWRGLFKWIKLPKIRGPSKVRNLREKRTAITAVVEHLWMLDNNSATRLPVTTESTGQNFSEFWRGELKEEKSLPLMCTKKHDGRGQGESVVCGIRDGSGNLCNSIPLPGRKRCKAHKGMRLQAAGNPSVKKKHFVSGPSETGVCRIMDGSGMDGKPTVIRKHYIVVQACKDGCANELTQEGSLSLVCGFISKEGSTCMALPEKGRKRCTSHKGRRIKTQG